MYNLHEHSKKNIYFSCKETVSFEFKWAEFDLNIDQTNLSFFLCPLKGATGFPGAAGRVGPPGPNVGDTYQKIE